MSNRSQTDSTIDILHHLIGQDRQTMDDLLKIVRPRFPDIEVRQEPNPNVSL